MKPRFILCFGMFFFGIGISQASAELKFCNKTPIELWTSIGYIENGKWFSKGWYRTSPGGCIAPIRKITNRYYYHHTRNRAFRRSWGDQNYYFCIHPENAFGPTKDGSCPRGFESKKFNKIDVGNSKSYTLDLTCPTCRNPEFRMSGGDLIVNYLYRDKIQGRNMSFPASGRFSSFGRGSSLGFSFRIDVGLGDLQENITTMLRPQVNKSDDCGDVVRLQSVKLRPANSGRAKADVNIHYERWNCTYADLPETRCTDTWIKLPFGGKTKGIPKCTTKWNTKRTSKTRVIETGISGTLMLTPTVSNRNRVRLSGEVVNVRVRNDLARFIVDALDVNLRRMAQRELEKSLGNGGAIQGAVPDELKPFVKLDKAEFYDRGGNELGVRANGRAKANYSQIASLCRQYTGFC